MTQLELESENSTETTSAPSDRGQHSLMDNLDTFLLTDFIDWSHDEPSSGEPFQLTEHPNGIMGELSIAPGESQFEMTELGPIMSKFPPPPSEDIADRLHERFKGKHRKYWNILLQESERKIP